MSFPSDTADRIIFMAKAPLSLDLINIVQSSLDFISVTRPSLEYAILDELDAIKALGVKATSEGSTGSVKRVEDIEFYEKKQDGGGDTADEVSTRIDDLLTMLGLDDFLNRGGNGIGRSYRG